MKIQELLEQTLLEGVCPGEQNYTAIPLDGVTLDGWPIILDPHFRCNFDRRISGIVSLDQLKEFLIKAYKQDQQVFDEMPVVRSAQSGDDTSLKIVVPKKHLTIVIHKVNDGKRFYNLRTVWTGAPKEYNRQIVLSTTEILSSAKFQLLDWPVLVNPDLLRQMENVAFHPTLIRQTLNKAESNFMNKFGKEAEVYKQKNKLDDTIQSLTARVLPLKSQLLYIYNSKDKLSVVLFRDLDSQSWEMRELVGFDYKKGTGITVKEHYSIIINS